MAEITVRVLNGSDWPLYRDVRLRALEESPASFSAQLADEADQDEQFWRDRMDRFHLLLAERDGRPQGIASLGPDVGEPSSGEIFGFRSTGSRRPSRVADLALGDYETALVLSLVPDDTSVPNPTSDKSAPM